MFKKTPSFLAIFRDFFAHAQMHMLLRGGHFKYARKLLEFTCKLRNIFLLQNGCHSSMRLTSNILLEKLILTDNADLELSQQLEVLFLHLDDRNMRVMLELSFKDHSNRILTFGYLILLVDGNNKKRVEPVLQKLRFKLILFECSH